MLANGNGGMGSHPDTLIIIKLPHLRVLRVMSRSLFLVMLLITLLPSIASIIRGGSSSSSVGSTHEVSDLDLDVTCYRMLPNLFHDLVEQGLVKKGYKGLLLIKDSAFCAALLHAFSSLNLNETDLVFELDLDLNKNGITNAAFDFVFSGCFQNAKAVDGILKTGGIFISHLCDDPSNGLQHPPNYKLVYLRRFDYTILAMRKIRPVNGLMKTLTIQRPCGNEAKKVALRGLEDALLELPRKELGTQRIKFLPDLLEDSLESYPRHIFISDGKNGVAEWFRMNYPVMNKEFEMFSFQRGKVEPPRLEVSDWVRKHVREEDYVVMKAEEMLVEEMINEKTICLVDELFLECSKQQPAENSRERSYWECLALFGKLRDHGIAVHQWWS